MMEEISHAREIRSKTELYRLAHELGVRPDWHEPDEQGLTARWGGTELDFDNAMGCEPYGMYFPGDTPRAEMHVILCREEVSADGIARRGPDIAKVNLANLFAWASTPDPAAMRAERDEWRARALDAQAAYEATRAQLEALQTAQVGDYIGPRGPIPANVTEVHVPAEDDTWRRATPEELVALAGDDLEEGEDITPYSWATVGHGGSGWGGGMSSDEGLLAYAPLKVTGVR